MGLYYSGGNFQPGPNRSGYTTSLINVDNPTTEGFNESFIAELFQTYQGIDTLHVSCEGKAIIAVHPSQADEVLAILRSNTLGKNAAIIGEAKATRKGQVFLKTLIGGHRILDKPIGEPIPRVC